MLSEQHFIIIAIMVTIISIIFAVIIAFVKDFCNHNPMSDIPRAVTQTTAYELGMLSNETPSTDATVTITVSNVTCDLVHMEQLMRTS